MQHAQTNLFYCQYNITVKNQDGFILIYLRIGSGLKNSWYSHLEAVLSYSFDYLGSFQFKDGYFTPPSLTTQNVRTPISSIIFHTHKDECLSFFFSVTASLVV